MWKFNFVSLKFSNDILIFFFDSDHRQYTFIIFIKRKASANILYYTFQFGNCIQKLTNTVKIPQCEIDESFWNQFKLLPHKSSLRGLEFKRTQTAKSFIDDVSFNIWVAFFRKYFILIQSLNKHFWLIMSRKTWKEFHKCVKLKKM